MKQAKQAMRVRVKQAKLVGVGHEGEGETSQASGCRPKGWGGSRVKQATQAREAMGGEGEMGETSQTRRMSRNGAPAGVRDRFRF